MNSDSRDDERDDAPAAEESHAPGPPPAASQGPYPRLMHYQMLTPTAPLAPGAAVRVTPAPVSSVPPAWYEDPTGRHQWRWWNGLRWSEHVADDGVAAEDPMTADPDA